MWQLLLHILVEGVLTVVLFSGAYMVLTVGIVLLKEHRQDQAIFKFVEEARRDFI